MTYRTKIVWLSSLISVLVLVLIGTVVFDPERINARKAAFAWLSAHDLDRVDSAEITGSAGTVNLVRGTGVGGWSVLRDGIEYPAKQGRIEDVLRVLSRTESYPVSSSSASSHARLGLAPGASSRVVLRSGNEVVLDLLVGNTNATGTEVYLRKNGSNEVRSGTDKLSSYLSSPATAWYNLRLFPEAAITVASVQQITVSAPDAALSLVLRRSEAGWQMGDQTADTQKVESYIRIILDAEGEDIVTEMPYSDGYIVIEIGDGTSRTIRLGAASETNQRAVAVSDRAYLLSGWAVERLLPDTDYFF
jgi:hypothetical protein